MLNPILLSYSRFKLNNPEKNKRMSIFRNSKFISIYKEVLYRRWKEHQVKQHLWRFENLPKSSSSFENNMLKISH